MAFKETSTLRFYKSGICLQWPCKATGATPRVTALCVRGAKRAKCEIRWAVNAASSPNRLISVWTWIEGVQHLVQRGNRFKIRQTLEHHMGGGSFTRSPLQGIFKPNKHSVVNIRKHISSPSLQDEECKWRRSLRMTRRWRHSFWETFHSPNLWSIYLSVPKSGPNRLLHNHY